MESVQRLVFDRQQHMQPLASSEGRRSLTFKQALDVADKDRFAQASSVGTFSLGMVGQSGQGGEGGVIEPTGGLGPGPDRQPWLLCFRNHPSGVAHPPQIQCQCEHVTPRELA